MLLLLEVSKNTHDCFKNIVLKSMKSLKNINYKINSIKINTLKLNFKRTFQKCPSLCYNVIYVSWKKSNLINSTISSFVTVE